MLGGWAVAASSTAATTSIGIGVLALVALLAATGLSKSTRFQAALLAFEYVTIVGFCLWGIVFGRQPFEWAWLNPFGFDSVTALTQGLVLAVFIYWGWDAAF